MTDDLFLEWHLVKKLTERLKDLEEWLAEALDDAIVRDVSRERNDGGKSADTLLPFNDHVSQVGVEVAGTLQVWVDSVATTWKRKHPGHLRAGQSAKWLRAHVVDLAKCEDALAAYDEITDAHQRATRGADIPPPVEFVGPCQSTMDGVSCEGVYCMKGADVFKCRTCVTVIDVPAVRATTQEVLRDRLFDLPELQTALTIASGKRVPKRTIESWVQSERLVARGGRYLLSDALVLLAQHKPKQRRKAS